VQGELRRVDGSRTCLSRILRLALPVAGVALALALAGCGDMSLVDSLQRESPGDLRFSPGTAAVPLDTSLTLTVVGGIWPYSLVSGAVTPSGDVTPVDDDTWQFPAQTSITGDWQDFTIGAADGAGVTATAVVRVYAGGPTLNVTELTLPQGVGWTFSASGGAAPYTWEVDGATVASGTDSYAFSSTVENTYLVSVIDSLDHSQVAIVTVVPDGVGVDPLSISPVSAVILPGAAIAFTALGGDGTYAFSAPDGGTIDNANPAIYVAPTTIGSYVARVADSDGASASAKVIVTATGTLPVLFPTSAIVSVIGEELQFNASGGSPPYTYSSNKPDIGSVDPSTGLYRQLLAGNVVVTAADSGGLKDNTLVKWKP
jgi:hypothetical protein